MTQFFVKGVIDVRETEARALITKALYTPYGITALDPDTGRVYPNIIDFERFDTKFMEQSVFNPLSKQVGMRFDLEALDGTLVKRIFLNEDSFFGAEEAVIERRLVTIDYGTRQEPGVLEIRVS